MFVSTLVGLTAGCSSATTHRASPPVAAQTVTAEDMERSGESIERVLQAKVPGVVITRTASGALAIEIRGVSSVNSGTAPLYVLDDMPLSPGPGGALMGVNPHDIETIRVLKDPSETGIYGVRGANGVILITTKRPGGKRSDPPDSGGSLPQ